MCKVSILIPVYNTESTLRRCLNSVINQTLKDIEIIITNDGSTDKSQLIIEEYARKDCRIKYTIEENSGLGATRNKGIEMANGEYIAFLDSDDWVDLNYYETMYEIGNKNSSDLVISSYKVEIPYKNICNKVNVKYNDKITYLKDLLNGKVNGFSWNKLYKKVFINENKLRFPLRGELENVEDQYFSIRCVYLSERIDFINTCDIHYFINEKSITNKYQSSLIRDIYTLYKNNLELFQDSNMKDSAIREMNKNIVSSIVNIINNEFKPDNKKTKTGKIDTIRSIYSFDVFKKNIMNEDIRNYRNIDKIYIKLLKRNKINTLYYIAKYRFKLSSIRSGIYKS